MEGGGAWGSEVPVAAQGGEGEQEGQAPETLLSQG